MNKLMKLSMVAALTLGLVACAKTEGSEEKGIKIGMVTDSGTIDDKSFNKRRGSVSNANRRDDTGLFRSD